MSVCLILIACILLMKYYCCDLHARVVLKLYNNYIIPAYELHVLHAQSNIYNQQHNKLVVDDVVFECTCQCIVKMYKLV